MGRLLLLVTGALALALGSASPAGAFTKQDELVPMADGVQLATTLYLPDGTPPAEGWPAVMMLHGLGGTRADLAALAETQYVQHGYAVLTFDARGHGESGGVVGLDGPAEIGDVRALHDRLAARPDVDGARIGGWGVSYGAAAVLRAAVDGVAFAALVPHMTWSSLYDALVPQDLAKSGVLAGLLQGIERPSELLARAWDDALRGRNLGVLRGVAAERSTLAQLPQLRTPTFWLQGKRDFAFDLLQATEAYSRLGGPKRLYLGNLGHAPSTFASDDSAYFLAQGRVWFDRWLKGVPNGIDRRLPVEFASTPYVPGRIARYAGLPRTLRLGYALPGRRQTIRAGGKVDLRTTPLPRTVETFGRATVEARVNAAGGWPRLVAVLSALAPDGTETVIAAGGVPLRAGVRRTTIRLLSTSTPVPRRSRLRLVLANDSTAQSRQNRLYLPLAVPTRARVTISAARLTLPVLRRPVSPG